MRVEHRRTPGEVDVRDTPHPRDPGDGVRVHPRAVDVSSEALATTLSVRLQRLWAEAHHELDRDDLDPVASRGWADALDHITLALQALEDAGSPRSRTWGHRSWSGRRPGQGAGRPGDS